MRRITFILAISGIAILLYLLVSQNPVKIHSPRELNGLVDNSLVQTSGSVISERIIYGTTKLIKLSNGIELICDSCPSYLNKTIQILGTSEKYENITQINILRIIRQS